MPPDARLRDAAQRILDNVAAELGLRGIEVPERQFLTTGDVAHDFAGAKCAEALILTWSGTFQGVVSQGGSLANAPIRCAMPLTAQLTLALLRCVPIVKASGQAPTTAEMQDSGEQLMLDAMTLPAVVVDLHTRGDLCDDTCDLLGITQVVAVGPLGGVGGAALTLTTTLL